MVIVIAAIGLGVTEGYLHSHSAKQQSGNTLIIASSATPTSIDPAVAFDTNSVFFDDQIYQTLIGYGTTTVNGQTVGSLTPVPELATNWTVNPNGSILFNLRQNVTFSNGDPFNATDVQFTLDRVITMSQGASFHVAQFLNESGIHVLGPYKILLVPQAPYPWFLNLFQLWVTGIVDPNYVNDHGGVQKDSVNPYMSDHAMGTGPYMLQSYSSSEIVLVANPHYWGPQPNVTKIIYEVVPSPATQETLLEKGSVNVALNIPLNQMSTLSNYTNLKVKAGPTSSEYYIGLDENVTPFNNLDVRKAIEYAVNATQLTQFSTFGYGLPIQSVIAPTIESYIPAFKNYTQNLTLAQEYLDKAGYPHGFTTTFYYTSGDPIGSSIATILQQQLARINITLKLQSVESATFNDEVGLGQWPMFYEGWVNLLATPDDGMRPLFSSLNIGIYGNYNYFNNSTVTNDLIQAGKDYNQTQRDKLYQQVQDILAQQAVEVPLFNLENVIPMTTNVHDLYIYPTFDIFVYQVKMG
ncbi:diguanylate phosphodiesterase [Thermogymnomonas acidicola]|uniref:Diguanylate phosphodiesterase n=1 Tax=Thermogymnomonas acidicola TaxID=399579 RepID=A0AA37BTG8_9ARCH|nr:diguanylate phosphodiesterase [Thermogymnomonas acidicola]